MKASMANSAQPFRRPRPGRPAASPGRSVRLRYQTAVVHRLFKDYDEAAREERRACGVVEEGDAACCDACLAARIRTREVEALMLQAARELNSM